MLDHHLRSDGLMRFKTEVDGAPHDDSVDNYDQAFAIFALAHAYAVNRDPRFPLVALAILAALRRERAHPLGGFLEAIPGRAPLLSNPHMHLFEAALAWLDVAPTKEWRELAQEIGVLCQTRFIDSATGALREYFQGEWAPRAGEEGQIIEPGHQFEWAWLLARWRDHGGDVDLSVIRGLYAAADANGVDRTRSLALGELWMDGSVKDAGARMWPQTERIKAALAMARLWPEEQARFEADAVDAWAGVQRFIFPENRGLFRDKMKADGAFIAEGALASSLFHIVCAISELVRYANREARP
jgi:mannose-6-phosphate isomerase